MYEICPDETWRNIIKATSLSRKDYRRNKDIINVVDNCKFNILTAVLQL